MSNVIDERVVEMRFDNSDFEKNVKTSMTSLENLKKSLDVTESTKALENLGSATHGLRLDGLSDAVDRVGQKFSALEMIAVGALMKIGSSAVDAGAKLLKAFTVDNISAGWEKFGEKTKAVGTLVSQGFDLSDVEEQVERLNWFTDETSYNLNDMLNNVGKFTATNLELDDTTHAMEGIALWAAMSGQNAEVASRAMYQLSQALGSGYIKKQDWMSIQTANMDTQEFRQTAVDTAVTLKSLQKVGDDAFKALDGKIYSMNELFGDGLAKGKWFTTDVMMGTFEKYSAAVDQIYDIAQEKGITASEVLEQYGDELDEFGKKAFRAGQEARTWGDVVDSVKDAVGTGWMKTFELIFGNYEEATKLFTDLSNSLYDLFAESGNKRNELLESWKKLGGRDVLIETFRNIGKDVVEILTKIGEAFKLMFPEMTAKKLFELTASFRKLVNELRPSEEAFENLKFTFAGFAAVIRLVVDIFNALAKAIFPAIKPAKSFGEVLLKITGTIGKYTAATVKWIEKNKYIEKGIEAIVNGIKLLLGALAYGINQISNFISEIAGLETTQNIIQTIINVFKGGITVILGFVAALGLAVAQLVQLGAQFIRNFSFTAVLNNIKTFGSNVKTILTNVTNSVKQFFESIAGDSLGTKIDKIKEKFNKLGEAIKGIFSNGKTLDGMDETEEKAGGIKDALDKITGAIKSFTAQLTPGKIAAFAFSAAIVGIWLAVKKLTDSFSAAGNSVKLLADTFRKKINPIESVKNLNSILQISMAIGILAGSFYLLNQVDPERSWKILGQISIMLGELLVVAGALALLDRFIVKENKNLAELAITMLSISGAIVLLSSALMVMDHVNLDGIFKKVLVLGALCLELAATSVIISHVKSGTRGALTLLLTSLALAKVAKALESISNINFDNISTHLKELLAIVGSMALLCAAAGNIGIGSLLGLIGAVILIDKIIPILQKVSEIKIDINPLIDRFKNSKDLMIAIGAFVLGLTVLTNLLSASISKFALGIAILTGSVVLLMFAARLMKKLNPEEFKQGMVAIGVILGLFALLEGLSFATAKSKMIQFSVSVGLLTGALALMAGLAYLIGKIPKMQLVKGMGTISTFMLLLIALEGVSAFTEKAKPVALISVVVGLIALFGELVVLSLIPMQDILPAMLSMVGIMSAFGLVCSLIGETDVHGANIAQIAIMAMALIEMAYILQELSKSDMASLLVSMISLDGVMIVFGKVCKSITNIDGRTFGKNKLKAMLTVAGALVAIAASLSLLAQFSWVRILAAAVAVSGVLFALNGCIKLLSKMKAPDKNTINGILELSIALIPIAGSLAMLASYEWKSYYPAIGAIAIALVALGGVITALDKLKVDGKAALTNAAAIGVLSIALVILAQACKEFTNIELRDLDAAGAALLALTVAVLAVGALGKAGAEVSIAIAALAAVIVAFAILAPALGEMAKSIAEAANILVPALEKMQDIDLAKIGAGIIELARGIMALGAAGAVLAVGVSGFIALGVALGIISVAALIASGAFALVVESLTKLSKINISNIAKNSETLGKAIKTIGKAGASGCIGIAELGIAVGIFGVATLAAVGGVLGMSYALPLFAMSVLKVSSAFALLNADVLADKLKALAVGIAALGAAARLLNAAAVGMVAFGLAAVAVAFAIKSIEPALNKLENTEYGRIGAGFKQLVEPLKELINSSGGLIKTATGLLELGLATMALGVGGDLLLAGSLGISNLAVALESLMNVISDNSGNLSTVALGLGELAIALGLIALAGIASVTGAGGVAYMALALSNFLERVRNPEAMGILAVGVAKLAAGLAVLGVVGLILTTASVGILICAVALEKLIPALQALQQINLSSIATDLGKVAVSGLELAFAGVAMGMAAPGIIAMSGAMTTIASATEIAATGFERGVKAIDSVVDKVLSPLGIKTKKAGEGAVKGLADGVGSPLAFNSVKANTTKIVDSGLLGTIKQVGGWNGSTLWTKTDTAGKAAVTSFVNGSSDPQAVSQLRASWTNLMQNGVLSVLSEVGSKISTWFSNFDLSFSGIKDIAENLGDTVTNEVHRITSVMDVNDMIAEQTNKIYEEGANIFEDFGLNVDGASEALGGLGGSSEKAKDEMSKLSETIKGQMDIFSEFSAKTDLTADKLLANMKSQIDGVTNWANMMAELGNRGINQGLLEYLGNLGPQGYEYVNAFVNMTGEQLEQAGQYFEQSLILPDAASASIQNSFTEAGMWASVGFANGISAVEAAAKAKEMGLTAAEALEQGIEINSPSRRTMRDGVYFLEGFVEGLSGIKLQWVINTVKTVAFRICSAFSANLRDNLYLVKNAVEQLPMSIIESLSNISFSDTSWISNIIPATATTTISAMAANVGTAVSNGISTGIKNSLAVATTSGQELAKAVIQIIEMTFVVSNGQSQEIKKVGEAITNGMQQGMKNGEYATTNMAKTICTNVIRVFSSEITFVKFKQYGAYVSEGFAAGMESGLSRIEAAAERMVAAAEKATTAKAQIASPSKLFKAIGAWIPAGFAVGIENNIGLVENATEGMVESSVDLMSAAIAKVMDAVDSDMNLDPVITPVIDLSNVQNGVNDISEMFNKSVAVSALNASAARYSKAEFTSAKNKDQESESSKATFTFTQNNYSPKALNRAEIYRQTKNQFSQMKGMVNA